MKGLFTGEFDGKMSIDAALNLLALKDKYMMNSESILEPIDLAFERTQDIKIEQVWTCLSVANHYNLDSIQDLKKCIWEHQHDF
jgi:hypothetical protein